MDASCCSSDCCQPQEHSALKRELDRRWWLGIVFVAVACAVAYPAYAISAWFWIPSALAAWFGTYQTIYSKGCASCGAEREDAEGPAKLNEKQRATRLKMANQFLVAAIVLTAISLWLPILWPLTAIAGWFAASFYVAVWTRYLGCPEIGAIPSWIVGHPIATRCAPLERRDSRAG